MKTVLVSLMAAAALPLFAQKDASIRIYPEQGNQQISKHIYGQFAEHLGTCIYGGLWVGPESEIPNTRGYRNDVLNALKELKIPNSAGREVALPMNTTGWTGSVRRKTVPRW